MKLEKINSKNIQLLKLNQPYFYDKLYFALVEDGNEIKYGDFCSRIMKNGCVKVLKSLGLYQVKGARESKTIYVHNKLNLIINTTIADNKTVSDTIIELYNGKINDVEKFKIEDFSKFIELDGDYPHSVDAKKCTYIIFNKHNSLYKIGRSINVFDRLNSLRNEISPNLELTSYLSTDIEGVLHKEYKDVRVFGEWFKLNIDDILDIKNKYNFTILQL